jgi:hypothetical protein
MHLARVADGEVPYDGHLQANLPTVVSILLQHEPLIKLDDIGACALIVYIFVHMCLCVVCCACVVCVCVCVCVCLCVCACVCVCVCVYAWATE